MNKFNLYTGVLMLAFTAGFVSPSYAQQNKKKAKTTKTSKSSLILDLQTKIVDEKGKPIRGAEVTTREGAFVHYSGKDGKVSLKTKADGIILVEALGYEDIVIDMKKEQLPKVVKMKKTDMLASGKYLHTRLDGGETSQLKLVGAVTSITGDELSTYPDYSLSNTLQGRITGLVATPTLNGLGNNTSTLYVRGLHGKESNQPLVIIDGLERSLQDVIPEEVEKIEVLKDATAKILYGPRAASGVVVVTTRRGEANKRVIRTSVESGAIIGTRRPEYLNSYDYARLYNEARLNDGLPAFYSQQQLDGYKNSTGAYDLLYPNVDYYDTFVRNHSMYRKALVDLNGGNDKVRYSMIVNYIGGNGFEKVGDRQNLDRINARGNLDIKVTDYLSVIADAAVRLENKKWGRLDASEVYGQLSSTRPNEYPLTISPEDLGVEPSKDGIPYFGASLLHAGNTYAEMKYGGFTSERYVTSQTNIGLDFTLDRFVKGLSASAFVSFDNYNYFKQGQRNTYPTYAIRSMNGDEPEFVQMRKISLQDKQSRLGEETKRTMGWRGNVGYERTFGKHDLSAMFAYNYFMMERKGGSQDFKNSNTSLRLNYIYDKRYAFEGDLALMGSNRFYKDNRYFLSGAAGAGWIISNEDFLKDNENINFLKLKASFGIVGFDAGTDFLLYNTSWGNGSEFPIGEKNDTKGVYSVNFIRIGNPDLKWERSTEYNIGIEGFLFKNRLRFEANYFNELRDNIISSKSAVQAAVLGPFASSANVGKVRNNGIELDLSWNDRNGDFSYQIGTNLIWSKNKLLKWNEIDYKDDGMRTVGKPTDVIMGYKALGLFGKDVPLEGHPYQTLGNYKEGDIAYEDMNGDKIIDERDKVVIGNNFPRVAWGIDLNLQYKNWGLYVLGTSELGVDVVKNNSYYWMKGEQKYSTVALDRYHPENNPDGWYPSLTTTQGDNNFVNSTYWTESASFFRLKNVELSYTFSSKRDNSIVKKVKFFSRGTNLFVLSSIKELDPEVMNAGITNYPVCRTITGGVTLTF